MMLGIESVNLSLILNTPVVETSFTTGHAYSLILFPFDFFEKSDNIKSLIFENIFITNRLGGAKGMLNWKYLSFYFSTFTVLFVLLSFFAIDSATDGRITHAIIWIIVLFIISIIAVVLFSDNAISLKNLRIGIYTAKCYWDGFKSNDPALYLYIVCCKGKSFKDEDAKVISVCHNEINDADFKKLFLDGLDNNIAMQFFVTKRKKEKLRIYSPQFVLDTSRFNEFALK